MLPTSCRFLFYELVTRKVISKGGTQRPDQVVIKALVALREQGLIPWEAIVDETREIFSFTGSETVTADLMLYLDAARIDPWKGNPPLILTESRSLAGVLRDLCADYRCRIASTNGQVGGFLHTKVAPLLAPGARVAYLGDYDLCGGMIEVNTRRVLIRSRRAGLAPVSADQGAGSGIRSADYHQVRPALHQWRRRS